MKKVFILMLFLSSFIYADEYCKAVKAYEMGDVLQAKKILDPLAFKREAKAKNLLGLVNIEEENFSASKRWLQGAASSDNKAAYNLGLYYFSLGNISQTKKWMHKAEKLASAKMALGILYLGSKNEKALAYFYQSAQEGNLFSKQHLCAVVAQDKGKIKEEYQTMCKGLDVQSSYVTGKFYTSPKKYGSLKKSIYYLQYAADKGNKEAMNLLGEKLYERAGPSDQENALNYFLKASALGSVDAKVNAAWIYFTGPRWIRRAMAGKKMLEEALLTHNSRAQLYMGILMIKGLGFSGHAVAKDLTQGWDYVDASFKQNDPKAAAYIIHNSRDKKKLKEAREALKIYRKNEEKAKAFHYLYDKC